MLPTVCTVTFDVVMLLYCRMLSNIAWFTNCLIQFLYCPSWRFKYLKATPPGPTALHPLRGCGVNCFRCLKENSYSYVKAKLSQLLREKETLLHVWHGGIRTSNVSISSRMLSPFGHQPSVEATKQFLSSFKVLGIWVTYHMYNP